VVGRPLELFSEVIGPLSQIRGRRKYEAAALCQGGVRRPRKIEVATVRIAHGLAWSSVTSSIWVNRIGGVLANPADIPFGRVSKNEVPDPARHSSLG